MKFTKLLFIPFVALLACSKHDSPPALENAKVTTTTVTAPAGLTAAVQSGNTYASTAASYVDLANTMSTYTNNFTIPKGATKINTAITASNARVSATAASTVTYTWSDQNGLVGYQITDEGTSYKWELFYKATSTDPWIKYLNAEAKKDGSSGSLKVYDYFFGNDPTVVFLSFTWAKVNNQFTLTMTEFGETIILNVDLTTKAGTVNVYNGLDSSKVLYFNYTWDKDGKGSWKEYDIDGTTVLYSGTW